MNMNETPLGSGPARQNLTRRGSPRQSSLALAGAATAGQLPFVLTSPAAPDDPINEAKNVAQSTLTGIMGRESASSGQSTEWEAALGSKMRLGPAAYEMGAWPVPLVAMPGQYRFS
jgi:hypothetical protein